jgi:hypothetical protein
MKETIKAKYESLAALTKGYIKDLKGRKAISAFFYKPTEQKPEDHLNPEGKKQFNVVEVRELINHVMTANQLGYITMLTASPQQLTVNYVEKEPSIPYLLQIL